MKSSESGNGSGSGSMMMWAGMNLIGPVSIYRINGIIDRHIYVNILEKNLLSYAAEHLSQDWILQTDNNPKSHKKN